MKPKEHITLLFEDGDKLANEIVGLMRIVEGRNKTLLNLLRLLLWRNYGFLFHNSGDYDIRKYKPKRGQKGDFIPLKFVMAYLGVSHRTAQDYIRTVQALDKLHELFILTLEITNERILLKGKELEKYLQ